MESTARQVERGHYLWHELLTRDRDAAIDFYAYVIGWKTQVYDFEGHGAQPAYTMWLAGDVPVGGVMQIDPATMGEIPPNWMAYVSTPDADATVRQAKSLGGTVLAEPFDVPTVGRLAVLADPQGAAFAILTPGSREPIPEVPAVGSFSWNELATTDSNAAFDFYHQLFGWKKLDDVDMGEGWTYRIFGLGDKMFGGMYVQPPDMPAPPHWLYYAHVADLEATLERVKERGGQVLNGPMEVPGGDRIAQCMDPQGAVFALHAAKK